MQKGIRYRLGSLSKTLYIKPRRLNLSPWATETQERLDIVNFGFSDHSACNVRPGIQSTVRSTLGLETVSYEESGFCFYFCFYHKQNYLQSRMTTYILLLWVVLPKKIVEQTKVLCPYPVLLVLGVSKCTFPPTIHKFWTWISKFTVGNTFVTGQFYSF